MDKLLTKIQGISGTHPQHSHESLRIVTGTTETTPTTPVHLRAAVQAYLVPTLADGNTSTWTGVSFERVDGPSMTHDSPPTCLFLTEAQAFILNVREDLDRLPPSIRSSHSAELCRQFATRLGNALAGRAGVRCAVFGDEEDGVMLVAHSRASLRQVSFEFGAEDSTVNIISIDETMRRSERACRLEHVRTLGEAIAWLSPR